MTRNTVASAMPSSRTNVSIRDGASPKTDSTAKPSPRTHTNTRERSNTTGDPTAMLVRGESSRDTRERSQTTGDPTAMLIRGETSRDSRGSDSTIRSSRPKGAAPEIKIKEVKGGIVIEPRDDSSRGSSRTSSRVSRGLGSTYSSHQGSQDTIRASRHGDDYSTYGYGSSSLGSSCLPRDTTLESYMNRDSMLGSAYDPHRTCNSRSTYGGDSIPDRSVYSDDPDRSTYGGGSYAGGSVYSDDPDRSTYSRDSFPDRSVYSRDSIPHHPSSQSSRRPTSSSHTRTSSRRTSVSELESRVGSMKIMESSGRTPSKAKEGSRTETWKVDKGDGNGTEKVKVRVLKPKQFDRLQKGL